MKRTARINFIPVCLLGLACLAGCTPAAPRPAEILSPAAPLATAVNPSQTGSPAAATASPPLATTASAGGFSDPFAYCQAVGTIDQPDARYTGPQTPEAVVKGVMKASGAPADAPVQVFSQGTFWRCMDHQVYGCFVGANLPCESKPNPNPEPNPAMNDYCQANPNVDFIPAAVSGHDTLYAWACKDGKALVSEQVFHADPQGYIREIWYALTP